MHPSVDDAFAINEAEGFRTALQMDLWRLRDEVVAQLGTPGGRQGRALAVVLLDEVQRYAGAAGRFIVDLLRSGGLGTEQDPIPVAFTYRKDLNYAEPYEQVRKALDAVSNWAIREELQPLREAVSDRSIYLHLLLHRAQPLVFSPTLALLDVDRFYNSIHRATASGYPSQFREKAEPLNNVLLTLQDVNVVVRRHRRGRAEPARRPLMSTAPRSPDVSDALARVESLLAGSPGPRVPDRLDPACIRWVCLVAGLDADAGNAMRHARVGAALPISTSSRPGATKG